MISIRKRARSMGTVPSRILLAVLLLGLLTGCQQMGSTEYGVKFRKLPTVVGGGVSSGVVSPGELVMVWPWESIYRIDTSVRGVTWGGEGLSGENDAHQNFVHTRALDGNEVVLLVTVRYRVKSEPEGIRKMVAEVASSNEEVEQIVTAVARADIRTYMNELRTSDFLVADRRYAAVDRVKAALVKRLSEYNIEVTSVVLDDFRFERILPDGSVDASYQEKLNDTQRLREQTEREKARMETIIAKKGQEFNDVQAIVNRQIAEAEGEKQQATLRGDGYLQTRSNEAKGLLAQGKAEVEGLIERIQALSGPGGKAILKLDLAKNLLKNDPRFVVMNQGTSNQLSVNRTDTNEIIRQAGLFEALQSREKAPESPTPGQ